MQSKKHFTFFMILMMVATLSAACGTADEPVASIDSLEAATYSAALVDGSAGETPDEALGVIEEAAPELERSCAMADVRARVIARYDGDQDGELSEAERGEMGDMGGPPPRREGDGERGGPREGGERGEGGPGADGERGERPKGPHGQRFQELMRIYDFDRSHSLEDAEKATLEADLEIRCDNRQLKLLADFDADQDGELSDAEHETARETIHAEREARHLARVAEVDADADGEVSEEEHEAAREAHEERCEEGKERAVEAFDADGDGELSEAEHAALQDALRAWVRLEGPHPLRGDLEGPAGEIEQ